MAGEETTNQQKSNININYNAAQTGIDMDKTLGQITKGKLTYALNANIENFDSNSVNYQNEEGNELCLEFPDGYVLIGKHFIQEESKHVFFLVNPTTNASQIGYMVNNDCVYHTLLSLSCLNFDIDYPVHKIVHKINNCATEIYWTDGLNPRRYLDISATSLPDTCNKLNIQPDFDIPKIALNNVINGGELTAGTYQFAIQYANADGIGYTSYYSVTNPIPIANPLIVTAEFNYPVNRSIVLDLSNIDTQGYYKYYNLAVIKTVNDITSVELVGTYLIDSATNQITYTGQNQTQIKLAIEDIFEKYPYYEIAQDVTSVQDILVWDQLTSIDRINFQNVASQISLKWESYKISATNAAYADPENSALLRGYLRDEVYAFEIVFLLKNGKQTDGFHIPGRALIPGVDDVTVVKADNDDFISADPADTTAPYWKIYNTAEADSGTPSGPTINGATPHKSGRFAFWQSTDYYPNDPFWGSLANTPIRHHKFPDILVSPAFETGAYSGTSYTTQFLGPRAVYPLGVRVDIDQIKTLLTAAGLLDDVQGFKIVRGNRSTNKSIVGKGIVRNLGKYTREGTTFMFPNYPYNDLRSDPFLLQNNNAYINECIQYQIDVITAGSIQYTNCKDGNATTLAVLPGVTYVCSTTKPVNLNATVSSINVYTNFGYKTYTIVSNSPTTPKTVISYTLFTAQTVTVTYGTPAIIVSSTTPSYSSGNKDYSVFLNEDATPCASDPTLTAPLSAFSDPAFSRTRFVLNSPETSFSQPTLGNVLKLESIIFGAGRAHFAQVENNAKYKLITSNAQKAALDSSYNIAISTGTFDPNAMFTTYQAYLTIYINSISRTNLAYSFNSISSYDYETTVPNATASVTGGTRVGVKQRMLETYQYLTPGVQSVNDTYDVNNFQREGSVFLKTATNTVSPLPLPFADQSPSTYNTGTNTSKISDTSRFTASSIGNCSVPEKDTAFDTITYYASLKNIFLNQWGELYTYETIDTGFQIEDLSATSGISVVFGGDTFICKFAFKTKLPFFIDNRVGAPDDSDVNYDELGNVAYPRFWHSSRSVLSNYVARNGTSMANMISIKAHNFDCAAIPLPATTTTTTTSTPGSGPSSIDTSTTYNAYVGKMYMFAYGVPYFYCESSVNVDLRQATNNRDGDYYPRVSSGIPDRWFQQTTVPISLDNTYNYNVTYSKQNKENYFSHIPQGWDGTCSTNFPFRAIYSDPQTSDPTNRINNWLIYRPVSFFDFPQNYGNLVSLDGIQNKAVLARFENKSLLYNTLLTIDTSNPQAAYLGNSSLFKSSPPIDFAETDLGYVGSQHKFLLKIPQGQITVDAKRGQIFLIAGNNATDITAFGSGVNRFMTDHLAFEILRYYPNAQVDNSFKGLGLSGVYDSKYDRVIITKLDYIPQPNYVGEITYNPTTNDFYLGETVVSLTDLTYFCNKSWTLSFNMNTKAWVSFHTYLPNYYIGESNFYYSGKPDVGMWRHLTNDLLNNNYYGTVAPYVIEYPFAYEYHDEILQNVKDYTRAYQYLPIPDGVYNDNAKIQTDDYYFNKAILYNGQQSTGLLKLVKKPTNNLAAYNQYPTYNADSKTILFTKSDSFYQYNTFWNVVKDKTKTLFDVTCESLSIDKVINQSNMDYGTRSFRKDPLRAKGLLIRHILDDRSDIHMVSQFIVAPSQISYK
jgi:hypothetical protein